MGRPNHSFEKRRRELEKKKKQEAKRLRKLEKNKTPAAEEIDQEQDKGKRTSTTRESGADATPSKAGTIVNSK